MFVVILDEYYSYATKGVALFTSQLRSLEISMIIPVQALDGLSPSSGDTQEKSMILGTTQMYVFEIRDLSVMEHVEKTVKKERIQNTKNTLDQDDTEVLTDEIELHEEYLFDPKNMGKFQRGFGAIVNRGEIYLIQRYYEETATRPCYLKKYVKIDFS